jgi:predicted anti-sigma-YlaC factor YlaD
MQPVKSIIRLYDYSTHLANTSASRSATRKVADQMIPSKFMCNKSTITAERSKKKQKQKTTEYIRNWKNILK